MRLLEMHVKTQTDSNVSTWNDMKID